MTSRHVRRHSSVLSLSQAAKLMKVIANNSCSTVLLIEIELSKAYLHRALRFNDSDSDSIYCLANVYLAVLGLVENAGRDCGTAGQFMVKMRGGTARLRDTRLQLAGLRVHVMRDIILNCSINFYSAGLTCWFAGLRVLD